MASVGTETGVEAIEALRAQWAPQFNAGKVDELGDLFYAEDARALPPNHEVVDGRRAIADFLRQVRESGDVRFDLGVIATVASGDLGYLVGTYVFTDASGTSSNGVTLEAYRLQDDGSWKCVADMWHSSEAPATG